MGTDPEMDEERAGVGTACNALERSGSTLAGSSCARISPKDSAGTAAFEDVEGEDEDEGDAGDEDDEEDEGERDEEAEADGEKDDGLVPS